MSTLQVLVEEMPGLPHCSTMDDKGKYEEDPVKSSSPLVLMSTPFLSK
jgi:hypothetical protein